MKIRLLITLMIGCATTAMAQGGLTDMSHSQQAMMTNTPLGAVKWTGGFWGDRFNMLSTTGIWSMWDTWNTPWEIIDDMGLHGSNGFRNFEVAAGTVKGKHHILPSTMEICTNGWKHVLPSMPSPKTRNSMP